MRGPRGRDPSRGIDSAQSEGVAGLSRQLLEVEELRAAVAFAERMDIGYVAHDDRGRLGKFGSTQTFEKIRLLKTAVNVAHAPLDKLPKLELLAVLGDFDGAKLAGPIKNILKKMPMNGAQVHQVKNPNGDAFGGALDNERPLDDIEAVGVGGFQVCCGERSSPDRGKDRRRSLGGQGSHCGKGVGTPLLVRPGFALEHLEHGGLILAQRIALDLLQTHRRKATLPRCRNVGKGKIDLIIYNKCVKTVTPPGADSV
jgi:hypothetical protein